MAMFNSYVKLTDGNMIESMKNTCDFKRTDVELAQSHV